MAKKTTGKKYKKCPYCGHEMANRVMVCPNKECGRPYPAKEKKDKAAKSIAANPLPSMGDTAIVALKAGSVNGLIEELGKIKANDITSFVIQCGGLSKALEMANKLKEQMEAKPANADAKASE